MQGDCFRTNSDQSFDNFVEWAREIYKKHGYVIWNYETGQQRTLVQNNSLHKYLAMLSHELNDKGLDARKVLKPEVDIPWDKDGRMAKNLLWRPIQEAMTGKKSTTEPKRGDYGEIYEVLNRHMAQKFGVSVPWPSKETQAERKAG